MRRGQITVFIIIGVLVLLVVGGVLFANSQRLQEQSIPRTEAVAEAAQPIQDFILACMASTAKDAIKQIGDHGGYSSIQSIANVKTNPTAPTEADAVMFSADSQYGVPYWWYLKSKNTCEKDCEFASKRPALFKRDGSPSIEGELEQAMLDSFPACVRNFEAFKDQKFTVETIGNPTVRAIITKDNVVMGLHQEFKATRDTDTYVLKDFATTVQVRLQDAYNLATNITVLESENGFLASHARQLIAAYSKTDPLSLPPISSIEFELGPGTVWVKHNVKESLKNILQSYVPLLQVFGTRNYHELPVESGTKNQETVKASLNRNAILPQLTPWPYHEAYLSYQSNWEPYFDLNCRGQVCRPDSFLNQLGFVFGIQKYNFAYDLSYPVLVEVREPEAFNGEGFSFRFALEGNLRDNEPLTSEWQPLPVTEQDSGSLLCRENQKTSGEFTINLHESLHGKPADGNIVFSCGQESCNIGGTANGSLKTKLPRCVGGSLSAVNADYVIDPIAVNTNTLLEQSVDLGMHAIVDVKASAEKYRTRKDVVTSSWVFDPAPVLFTKYDQSLVTMQRKVASFNSFASICGAPIEIGPDLTEMRLAAGNYSVTMTSLYHGNITFPPTRRCGDHYNEYTFNTQRAVTGDPRGPIEVEGKRDCFFVPEKAVAFGNVPRENLSVDTDNGTITLTAPTIPVSDKPCVSQKPFPAGSIQFDWEITPQMLDHARKVQFKTMAMGAEIPGTFLIIEDLDQINELQNFVDAQPELFMPEVTP